MSVAPRDNAADLASSAFHTTTPRMQAVMTSAKRITIIPGVIRRRRPLWVARCRSGIFRLDGECQIILTGKLNASPGNYRPIGGDAVNKLVSETTEMAGIIVAVPQAAGAAAGRDPASGGPCRSLGQFRDRLAQLMDFIGLAEDREIAADVHRSIAVAGC